MRCILASLVVLAGCGGDDVPTPDAVARCAPAPGPLPTTGMFADPLALELPATCVEGGLRDLPGRWFMVDPEKLFTFDYPLFEGDCDTGFRRAFSAPDDTDETDGVSFFTWTDGTRIYSRASFEFTRPAPEEPFVFTNAFAACMLPDGTLAGVRASFDTDRGERFSVMTGKRFGLKDDPAAGLTLVGEVSKFGPDPENVIEGYNVVVDGDHAYVVGASGFEVVNVADPTTPVVVGHLEGSYNDVRVARGAGKIVAFLSPIDGDQTSVVDVTDPATPTIAQMIPEYSHSVHVVTGATPKLYLATYGDTVPVYDITNPLAPVRLGAATVPGEVAGVHDLYVDGDRIYANNTTAGLVAFDVSAGLGAATEVGRLATSYSHASWSATTTSGRKVILHGDEGMTGTPDLGAFLRILDGDPASPTYMTELSRYQSRPEVGIHNIQLAGDRVYLSYYQDGVRIVDIADPTQPREVAHFNTWDPATARGGAFEGAVGVRVANGLVFVADIGRGLLILRED